MRRLLQQMTARVAILKKAIKAAENDRVAKTYPEGRLRISNTGSQKRYYHVISEEKPKGVFITKNDQSIARKLAEKDYNSRFLELATEELSRLERMIHIISEDNADMAFERMSPGRQELVRPYILTDEILINDWLGKSFKTNQFMPERKIYDTIKGEKVRSKSEALLANMFFEMKIPYRYECELRLKKGTVRYPDFTLLKIRTREEIYFEHFGLLDDENYLKSSIKKLDEYRENNIYPGKNLLFSYETEESPLDIKGIRKMVEDFFTRSSF